MGFLTMNKSLDKYIESFNNLKQSYRLLVTLGAIFFVFMCFDIFWLSEQSKKRKSLEASIVNTAQEYNNQIETQKNRNLSASKRNQEPKRQLIETLDKKIAEVKSQLSENTLNLIQPEDMAEVLRDIIKSSNSLKLQSLSKIETTSFATPTDQNQQQGFELYKHSMQIKLLGSYHATYEFLKALEDMEKKVSFEHFEYKVKNYPTAEIELMVSTLSLNKEWIGG